MFTSYETLTLNKNQNFPRTVYLKSRFDLKLYYITILLFKQNYSASTQR